MVQEAVGQTKTEMCGFPRTTKARTLGTGTFSTQTAHIRPDTPRNSKRVNLVGRKVALKTFNRTSVAPRGVDAGENYWRLIGRTGEIVEACSKEHGLKGRVLVKFHEDLAGFGLIAHNPIPNALWILASDLELLARASLMPRTVGVSPAALARRGPIIPRPLH